MYRYISIFMLAIFSCLVVSGQEVRSNSVRVHLGGDSGDLDTIPPKIKIIQPEFKPDSPFYTNDEEIEIFGEAEDRGKIRFVSVNNDIMVVNETGVFVSKVKLEPGMNRISLKSMDDMSNVVELEYFVRYEPIVLTLSDKIKQESKYYGLLIGIEEYKDKKLEDLDNPIQDARVLYNVLTTLYTFDSKHVTILQNPTRKDIIQELDILRATITENDNLLIFYAGHGFYDQVAEVGYWLPSDASQETSADWFPNSTLVNHLKAINSKHTLLITDACFAGSIFKSRSTNMAEEVIYERIYELPSRKAMTSGTLTEEVPDESTFIKYLIQRLTENTETYLSSEELFGSLKNAVISNSNVLPQYGEIQNVGNQGGDFIFLKKN